MTPTVYLWIAKFAVLLAVLGAVFAFGYRTAENKLQLEINTLTANLLAIDLKAKADEIKFKENLNVIRQEEKRKRDGVAAYYGRVLSEATNSYGSSQTGNNIERVGSTFPEQTISGCPIEVERRCVADAITVDEIAEFFKLNQFPTED